ncbi:hypothetical protein AB1L42_01635 [Thalassoglobus sp. JC818]
MSGLLPLLKLGRMTLRAIRFLDADNLHRIAQDLVSEDIQVR